MGTRPESIVLFDADCAPCSRVAKQLKTMNVPGLEVRSLHDPEMAELLTAAGHSVPTKPALVDIDGGHVTVRQGLSMRLRLARRIGFRRAGTLIGLAAAETRARTERASEKRSVMSRRRLMGGAAAASVGAVVFGTANPASAEPSKSIAPRMLSIEESEQLRATSSVADAMRVWGESGEETIQTIPGDDGEAIAVLSHSEPEVMTFIDMDSPEFAVTLRIDAQRGALQYFTTAGAPLAEVRVENGEVQATVLDASAAPDGADVGTQGLKEVAACMAICLGAGVSAGCAEDCLYCLTGSGVACLKCGICAGPKGVSCARTCRKFW